jgi:hypothetical protein
MNLDNNRIYKFLAGGMVSTLSVVVASFMALYLSSIDDRIGVSGYGVFSIQTALTADGFSSIAHLWVGSIKVLVNKYLILDVFFTMICAICFPAVIALIFTQYKEIMMRLKDTDCTPAQYKARDRFIFLAPISVIFCIICNGLVYFMLNAGYVSGVLTVIASISEMIRVFLLLGSLCFILYILFKRRKHIKQLYSQG